MVRPSGKSIGHSARTTRKLLRSDDTEEHKLRTTDWGYDGTVDTIPNTFNEHMARNEARRKEQIVTYGGKPYFEWAGQRFQGADSFQKIKIVDLPYRERIWMFFSGHRVFFVRLDHSSKKAQISNNWYTTQRALEALGLNLVSWQEEVDYEKALKGEF
jgi:hypothetical protein